MAAAAAAAVHAAVACAGEAARLKLQFDSSGMPAAETEHLLRRLEALHLLYLDALPALRQAQQAQHAQQQAAADEVFEVALVDSLAAPLAGYDETAALLTLFAHPHLEDLLMAPAKALGRPAGGSDSNNMESSEDSGSAALRRAVVELKSAVSEAHQHGSDPAPSQQACCIVYGGIARAAGSIPAFCVDAAADGAFLEAMAVAGQALCGWLGTAEGRRQLEAHKDPAELVLLVQATLALLAEGMAEQEAQQAGGLALQVLALVESGPLPVHAVAFQVLPLFQTAVAELAAAPGQQQQQEQAEPSAEQRGELAVRRAHALATRPCANLRCACLAAVSEAALVQEAKPLRCRGCRTYCGKGCAAADWPAHRIACRLMAAAAATS
ncbi:hypothetical protein ABPG75_005295 [Micractinium tetrahymenae]